MSVRARNIRAVWSIADRLPVLVAVAVIAGLTSPFVWLSWRTVFVESELLSEPAFWIDQRGKAQEKDRPKLELPASALTATLYDDLRPEPIDVASDNEIDTPKTAPLTIQLVAITVGSSEGDGLIRTAYVFDTAKQEYVELRAGDTLAGGVTVEAIDDLGIVLRIDGQHVRLELDT